MMMHFFIFLIIMGILIAFFAMGYFMGKTKKEDGMFIIDDRGNEKTIWNLDVYGNPNDILKKKEVVFKVFIKK